LLPCASDGACASLVGKPDARLARVSLLNIAPLPRPARPSR
jgi:hypothetical protein